MKQLFGGGFAATLLASIHTVTINSCFILFPPSRCVVVLFNPRKNKQHHILNSSRWVKLYIGLAFSVGGEFSVFMSSVKCKSCHCSRLSHLSESCLGERLPAGLTPAASSEVLLLMRYHCLNIVASWGAANRHDMEEILLHDVWFFFLHLNP